MSFWRSWRALPHIFFFNSTAVITVWLLKKLNCMFYRHLKRHVCPMLFVLITSNNLLLGLHRKAQFSSDNTKQFLQANDFIFAYCTGRIVHLKPISTDNCSNFLHENQDWINQVFSLLCVMSSNLAWFSLFPCHIFIVKTQTKTNN